MNDMVHTIFVKVSVNRWFGASLKKSILIILFYELIVLSSIGQNITRPNIEGPSGLNVNSYTGNLFYQRADLFVSGRLPLDFNFTYNSSDRASDWGYGYGWTFNYNRFYSEDDSSVTFYNGDGRRDQYMIEGNNFIAPKGIFDNLIKSSSGNYKIVSKDGMQYFFDDTTHKKLTSIVDRNNNQIFLSYSASILNAVKDGSGRTVYLIWGNNKLKELKADFNGEVKQILYIYDQIGTLKSVTDPTGYSIGYTYVRGKLMGSLIDANGNITNILYNSSNAVTKLVSCEAEKNISYNTAELRTYSIDVNNDKTFMTTYAYDKNGNLINKAGNCCGFNTSYNYDNDNNINRIVDANGHSSIYTYDKRGNLISETDPLGQTIMYTYESAFNKVTSFTDKRGNKTEYEYDGKGNLRIIKEPLNTVTRYTYENNGDIKEFTDPRGSITSFTYDTYGYLSTAKDALGGVTILSHDVWGNMISYKDANDHATKYSYDAVNKLLSITNALGNFNTSTYDGNGNILSTTDANKNKTEYRYDSRDKLLVVKDAIGNINSRLYDGVANLISSTDNKGNTTTFTYDKQSRKETEINATGDLMFYAYDGYGNGISITYPNGNTVFNKYDALNRVIETSDNLGSIATYQYDANNNKIGEIDAQGNTTTYQYDALNRLFKKTDPLGNSYNYSYDASGNIIKEVDRNGNITTYQYDLINRIVQTIDAIGFDTKFSYDAVGNTVAITDSRGNSTKYNYDALNRNIQETFANNSAKNYAYDPEGNIVIRKDNNGQITNYKYDKLNRLIVKKYPSGVDSFEYDATGHLLMTSNVDATVLFNYDKSYRILSENLNGKTTNYTYNVAAGIKKISYPSGRIIERKIDERNQLKVITEGNVPIANFEYNNVGENTARKYANGTSTSIKYNPNRQVIELMTSPSNIIDFVYTYDKEGNPLTTSFNHRSINSEQYGYDKKNQLTQFKKGISQLTSYNYDGVGNRIYTQVNGVTTNYSANSMNGYTDISNGTNVSNHYDANGNMLSDGAKNYNFDIENRLITINAGSTASYTYDALGRRIKKVTGSKVINFYFEGLQVIEERNESDVLQTSYVWGTWLDDIVMMKRNGNNFYYLSNTIGSVVAVTDAQGAIVERYEYDAFGKVQFYNNNYEAVSQSSIGNNYTFTGREYEVEIGNYFYRTRHFDVTQGRFLQKDPIGFIGGDQNLYTYVKNQPAFYNDPLGLKSNNGGNSSNYSQAFNNANTNVCRLDNDWNKAEGYDILNSGIYQPLSTITQSLDQFNRVLGYNGRRFISRELWMATGYGPGRFLKSWNSFFNNASKFGNGLGWIGQGVSTFNYFGNGNTTVAQDFNFLIGSGLTIAPIVATAIGAPVVITAVAALSIGYGIIQTASFFISNGTKSFEDIYFENRNTTNKIRLP